MLQIGGEDDEDDGGGGVMVRLSDGGKSDGSGSRGAMMLFNVRDQEERKICADCDLCI